MVGLLWVLAATTTAARSDSGTNRFSFTGPEIFPIDNQIGHLRAADLDGDGLQDLIVVTIIDRRSTCFTIRPARRTKPKSKPPGNAS